MSEQLPDRIDWSRIIAVTNRRLCRDSFWERLEQIVRHHPQAVILREKDLSEQEYRRLAAAAIAMGKFYGVPLIVHSWPQIAAAEASPSIFG